MNQDPINTVHCMTQGIVVQVEVEFSDQLFHSVF